MDERRKELIRRFELSFLSIYAREDNPNKQAMLISISNIMAMIDDVDPPFKTEMWEANNLMAINKFACARKNGEFWYFVKEKKKGLKQDPSADFY